LALPRNHFATNENHAGIPKGEALWPPEASIPLIVRPPKKNGRAALPRHVRHAFKTVRPPQSKPMRTEPEADRFRFA
jgi:hypothetical protein